MNIKLSSFLTRINKRFKKVQPITALDIGSSKVKALQVIHQNGSIRLLSSGIGTTIEEAIKSLQISPKIANISVSGQSVIIRYIEIPKMSKEEVQSAIQFEAEKYLPFPVDEVILDCHILEGLLDTPYTKETGKMRILFAACKKELIESHLKLLKGANITPQIIDVDSLALSNAFIYNQAGIDIPEGVFALLNIGAKFTNIHILTKDNSYLIRDIPIAGDDITRIISEKFTIGIEEAERLKCNIVQDREKEIAYAIKPVVERIAEEIRLSFDFFENTYEGSINKIFASGGSCKLKMLIEFLNTQLNMEISMWNPLKFLNLSIQPEFGVAAGLALR